MKYIIILAIALRIAHVSLIIQLLSPTILEDLRLLYKTTYCLKYIDYHLTLAQILQRVSTISLFCVEIVFGMDQIASNIHYF